MLPNKTEDIAGNKISLQQLREVVKDIVRSELIEATTLHINRKEVPKGIRTWVQKKTGKNLDKYTIIQSGIVKIGLPWHESDVVTYQSFRLSADDARPVGTPVAISGNAVIHGSKEVHIPSGTILVALHTYPQSVKIYTAHDAKSALPQSNIDLSEDEIMALMCAEQLTSSYRPKFDSHVYDSLVTKGYMKANKSITTNGKNTIGQVDLAKRRQADDNYRKKTGQYSGLNIR